MPEPALIKEVSVEKPKVKPTDHVHQWELAMKTYSSPRKDVQSTDKDILQKALFGVTVLLWKCVICSETRQEEILGSDENQLDELLGKVELFGPQYVQNDGKTFVIAKWQPAPQPSTLPLR